MDLLLINPGNASGIYQDLSRNLAAIEPPTWALLLAEAARAKGYAVGILDVNAERLNAEEATERIISAEAKINCFVVYGQNVNSGTVAMSGACALADALKSKNRNSLVVFVGSYVQALPKKALIDEPSIDIVLTNEGVYSLLNLLRLDRYDIDTLKEIKGICFRAENNSILLTDPEIVVPSTRLDEDLPGYAWDLLPFEDTPLDLYRSPLWHAEYNEELRTPYAAIQTSLGCNFGCSFCMINIINRSDNDEIGVASNYKGMRFWSVGHTLNQFDKLAELGVRTIRVVDEMFLLYRKHYEPLCDSLSKRPYADELRMWAYSRVDTVTNPEVLKLVRSAGFKWLCLGIESATKSVRLEVSKGKFEDVDIAGVISQVHEAGIEVLANYIVGLPGETQESMRRTLDFSKELCTSGWNMYTAMALPGSELYRNAVEENLELPKTYTGFSWHSKDSFPLPTKTLSSAEIVAFRDLAFVEYHTDPQFVSRIRKRFGEGALETIRKMTDVKLDRDLLSNKS